MSEENKPSKKTSENLLNEKIERINDIAKEFHTQNHADVTLEIKGKTSTKKTVIKNPFIK